MKRFLKSALTVTLCATMLFTGCETKTDKDNTETKATETETETEITETDKETAQESNEEPEKKPEDNPDDVKDAIEVSNAGDLIDAIEAGADIVLTTDINLTPTLDELYEIDSSEFKKEHKNVKLESGFDGVELVITDIDGLTIRGKDGKKVELQVEPRYADVLRFENCANISISSLIMGHTPDMGSCVGDVVEFVDCENIKLEGVDLYGCGAYGIVASNTDDIRAENSVIRDCSYGMIDISDCSNAYFENCTVTGIGGYGVIRASDSDVTLDKCSFNNNDCENGLSTKYEDSMVSFRACYFGANETEAIYRDELLTADGCTFDNKCFFTDIENTNETSTTPDSTMPAAVDLSHIDSPEAILEALELGGDIKIEDGFYNLSEFVENVDADKWNAEHQHVRLDECWDGHEIVIENIDNINIYSASGETWNCSIQIDPRYADVLAFINCNSIIISGIEFGHSYIGECNGNVLGFDNCDDIWLYNLDLYGCGVYGIDSIFTGTIHMYNSVIHDCESGPAYFVGMRGNAFFSDCSFIDSTGGFSMSHSSYGFVFENCNFGDFETTSVYFNDWVELIDCTFGEILYYPENGYGGIEEYNLTALTVQDYFDCFPFESNVNDPDYEYYTEMYWVGVEYFCYDDSVLIPIYTDGMLLDSSLLLEEYEYSIYNALNGEKVYLTMTESTDGKYLILNEVNPETGVRGKDKYYLYFYSTDGSLCPDMCKLVDGDYEIWYVRSY